jgi:hypothetical protein
MRDKAVTAVLNKSEAARDFIAMLPVSIRMRDHLGREKTVAFQGRFRSARPEIPLTTRATSAIGHDGLTIPPPGSVLLGKVDSSVQIFDIPGSVEAMVEVIE